MQHLHSQMPHDGTSQARMRLNFCDEQDAFHSKLEHIKNN